MTPCSIAGCEKPHNSHGLCGMHGYRMAKYGSPELPVRTTPRGGPCAAPGCTGIVRQGRHCPKHLWRLKTHGSLDLPPRAPRPPRTTVCAAEGCEKRRVGTVRWCSMHNKRMAVYGVLEPAFITAEDRFWRHVQRGGLGCWEWIAHVAKNGYGQCSFRGRRMKAHRVAYELLVGPIPDGMTVDHLCQRKTCCNPRHFELVPPGVNSARSVLIRDTCPQGHPYDEANTHYRLRDNARCCKTCKREQSRKKKAA